MAIGRIRWEMEVSTVLNLIRATGVIMDNENNQEILIENTFQILELAMENRGTLIPLEKFPPTKEKKNSIYFEIIFKSRQNLEDFLEAVISGSY